MLIGKPFFQDTVNEGTEMLSGMTAGESSLEDKDNPGELAADTCPTEPNLVFIVDL